MYFKDTTMMTRDELAMYVKSLEREIVGQQEQIRSLRTPNRYFIGLEREFRSHEQLLDFLPGLSVKQVTTFRKLDTCFVVKISEDRIDQFREKSHAEAAAMLHRPG